MKTEIEDIKSDLNFYGSDPGAVKYGNFINYYSFHDVSERINNLNPRMFPKQSKTQLVCLDVGCNTGDLSKALYSYLEKTYPNCDIQMLAVDIDPKLIERAKEGNEYPGINFNTSNIMDTNDRTMIQNYLTSFHRTQFDFTFCFSITIWIHLNNGDIGLLNFLRYIRDISVVIIIEPQPWKCYRNAQRRLKKSGHSFEYYSSLQIKGDVEAVIESVLSESHYKTYQSDKSSWDRKVLSFLSEKF
ncbi:pre-miRNA 5'-monophosphate methyltransferase [Trichoplusia ni]|uniref:RNA methyltransferase n=1 Tax=Trichoplusia ni TaxID=7111 RepID=A0A7E5WZI3_TRINI|nr:pre-miRNA 5'-monophosphate methyltransferase [Trichoplusia ni]